MKINDLKSVISTESIRVYFEYGVYYEFKNESTEESRFINKEGESLWKLYGECEIEQLYVNSANGISIDLK